MENQTFTATGFSQEIGIHPNTVFKWIRSGKLQAHKNASNKWEIPASEVDRIKRQIIQKEVGSEEARAAFRSLEVRWRQGLVDRMTELLIAAQRYRMGMWEWKQEEDPIQRKEVLDRVLRVSFPDLLDKAENAKRWRDFSELGSKMFKDVTARK
jgi:transposase-like protein